MFKAASFLLLHVYNTRFFIFALWQMTSYTIDNRYDNKSQIVVKMVKVWVQFSQNEDE